MALLSVVLTPQQAGQVISLMNTRTHARTHSPTHTQIHMNMYTIVSLTFGSVAAAMAGQVVIGSKYTSSSAQLMLSHRSSIRHSSVKMTNVLQRISHPGEDYAD